MAKASLELVAYQVPKYGEDPTDEMVDFMNECQQPWDGDDSGIHLEVGGVGYEAGPGDWIVCGVEYVVMDDATWKALTGGYAT